jgi:hypothetical protein
MHYCQSCVDPTPMEPEGGFAVCPRCGQNDDAGLVQPLFIVTGASGSGKTTLYGPLARSLTGRCVVFDVDWLLDAAGVLSRGATLAELAWDGLDQAWLAVAHGVAQSGLPTALLGPFTPARIEENVGRKWVGQIHTIVLDCPDQTRRERIENRPRWRSRDIDEQVSFGSWLRKNITSSVDTSRCSPEEAANAVADWVIGLPDGSGHVYPSTLLNQDR